MVYKNIKLLYKDSKAIKNIQDQFFVILGIIGTFSSENVLCISCFCTKAYQNPREATGRIVCANCHLAQKPTEVEVPQAVLPDTFLKRL